MPRDNRGRSGRRRLPYGRWQTAASLAGSDARRALLPPSSDSGRGHRHRLGHGLRVTTDAANLTGLLQREARICMNCASVKLVLSLMRVKDAADNLATTLTLRRDVGTCPVCGRNGA